MFDSIEAKAKAFLAWVYEWVTVLTAALVGGLSIVFDLLDAVGVVDWTPILPANYAAKIVTAVAIAKGLYAWYRSRKAA